MKRNLLILGLFASLAIGSTTWAQVPAVPGAPVAPAAAEAAKGNLWSFLLPNKEQCAHLKNFYCESAVGQMVNGLAGPFSLMSGGLIKNRCLQNKILNDLKKGADTPAGTAAAIAADAAEAKARRESVRALGLVDCNYWPEAIDVLIVSLRKDRSECVRFEAALALRNGCCCNKATIKALEMSVSGSNADGFPAERSERVRAVAGEALARCPIVETEEDIKKGKLTRNMMAPSVDPTEYYKKVALMSHEQLASSARTTLTNVQQASKMQAEGNGSTPAVVNGVPAIHQRSGSLSGIISNAFAGNVDPQTRMPFFSGLTRALTGRQENTVQQFVNPTISNVDRLPEIQTITPTEISVPLPTVEGVAPTPAKPKITPVEIVPSPEFMNPPREKKLITPVSQVKPGSDFIQLSPHVRQMQTSTPKSSTAVEMFPATQEAPKTPIVPMPTPNFPSTPMMPTVLPATHIAPPAPVLPATHIPSPVAPPAPVLPATHITTPTAPVVPAANFTVINMPPAAPTATLGQARESRPTLPPEIVQTNSAMPRETRGTVTIEIGGR